MALFENDLITVDVDEAGLVLIHHKKNEKVGLVVYPSEEYSEHMLVVETEITSEMKLGVNGTQPTIQVVELK